MDTAPGTRTFSSLVAHFRSETDKMIQAASSGAAHPAELRTRLDSTKAAMDTLRQYIGQFLVTKTALANKAEDEIAALQTLLLVLQLVSGTAILAALVLAFKGIAGPS